MADAAAVALSSLEVVMILFLSNISHGLNDEGSRDTSNAVIVCMYENASSILYRVCNYPDFRRLSM